MHNGISKINIHSIRRRSAYGKDAPFLDTVNYLLLVVEFLFKIAVSVETIIIMKFIEKTLLSRHRAAISIKNQNRNKPANI